MTPPSFIESAIENGYIQTIAGVEYAEQLSAFLSQGKPRRLRCQVKLDTGMTRFGISNLEEFSKIKRMPCLKPEAVFTHFPCADSPSPDDVAFTINQQSKLVELAGKYNLPYHSQNSAGTLYHRDFGGSAVRAGIALYGLRPNTALASETQLQQVMTLKSAIAQIREVGKGVPVSYGRTYVTQSPSRLAVIPIGYADGFSRLHSNKGSVYINGCLAPIRGRVCMDYTIVDVTEIDTKAGDEVIIYGTSHGEVGIEHIADSIGTIPYEVTCAVSARVPRVAVN